MPRKSIKGEVISSKSTLQRNRKYTIDEVSVLPNGKFMTSTAINRENPDVRIGKTKHSFIGGSKKTLNPRIEERLDKMMFGRSLKGLNERQLTELMKKETFGKDDLRKANTKPAREIEIPKESTINVGGTSITDTILYLMGFKN